MNNKHKKTIDAIFTLPPSANIKWDDIESLFIHLGADVIEAAGSRVCIVLNGKRSVFHRPHPKREAGKGMVKSVRIFLNNAGVI